MDVRQIEYFVLAAKAGSFSAAAKSAFVTQQTLSASVASLEGEVKRRYSIAGVRVSS